MKVSKVFLIANVKLGKSTYELRIDYQRKLFSLSLMSKEELDSDEFAALVASVQAKYGNSFQLAVPQQA